MHPAPRRPSSAWRRLLLRVILRSAGFGVVGIVSLIIGATRLAVSKGFADVGDACYDR